MYATVPSFHYTTSDINPKKAFEYYYHSVTKHFIPAGCESPDQDFFHGEVKGHQCGQLLVGQYSGAQHIWTRTESDVRTRPDEDMVLMLLDSGSAEMQQVGRRASLNPGDIMLLDGAKPFVHNVNCGAVSLVRIPRQLMRANMPHAEKYANIKIADGLSIKNLIAGLIRECYDLSPEANGLVRTKLANALINTLSVALESQDTGAIESYDSRSIFEKSLVIIDSNLDDQDLTVTKIADLLHVSERTLSRAFARQGQLASRLILTRRLAKSYQLLTESGGDRVTQIAYTCGFNDLAHFSRSFKKMYGASPSKLTVARPTGIGAYQDRAQKQREH